MTSYHLHSWQNWTTAVKFRRQYISRYGIFIKVYYIHLIKLLLLNPLGSMCRRNLPKGRGEYIWAQTDLPSDAKQKFHNVKSDLGGEIDLDVMKFDKE